MKFQMTQMIAVRVYRYIFGKTTGNIFRESCKSCKQTSTHTRVCLQDLLVSREIFLVFITKGKLIYI